MAAEARRGCGYRKIGGMYLVSDGQAMACDRLPILLEVCPCCGGGIKQSRGWTWVDLNLLVDGHHDGCRCELFCPLCHRTEKMGKCGLLWIGAKFYHSPRDFEREAAEQGISRRIAAIPRGFKVGETWILLAHPEAVRTAEEVADGGLFGQREVFKPGIFSIWKPQRIEKILPESLRDGDEAKELVETGITPVFVPDGDPDHRGSVYDDAAEEEAAS
jgi:hypothetical protein